MTTIERTCKKCRHPFTAEVWRGEVLGFSMSLTELMCPACRNVGTDRVANFKPEMLELDSLIGKGEENEDLAKFFRGEAFRTEETEETEETEVNPMWVGKHF